MEFKDYYKILGVDKKASDKEVKKAYRKLARQLHPDINPNDPRAEERFKDLNEAYEVLSDPEKRKKYDLLGSNWKTGGVNFDAGSGGDPFSYFKDFGWGGGFSRQNRQGRGRSSSFTGFGDFSDFFNTYFGSDGASMNFSSDMFRTSNKIQSDVEYQIEVTLKEAYSGTEKSFQIQRQERCSTCYGTGRMDNNLCRNCGGSGIILVSRQIQTRIPPGVKEGSKIRLRGEGEIRPDGQRGDMYLIVKLLSHDFFELKDNDLYCKIPISITEAALGAEINIPTLNSKQVQMKIPPETQNGKKFRLSGMGMPKLKGGIPGNMIVEVNLVMPQNLTQKEKELFKEMARIRSDNPRVYTRMG
ncbi:MAG TPA: J domain-containing protein [Candidatus Eremiobacteraeota bacterium]|nr:MAG: Chaperone protein DnaJ [bacterium ADurb.Bin363]HPZ09973.1 J domain-containing protein [Candidatus Eremiobacteraeota bacterium]